MIEVRVRLGEVQLPLYKLNSKGILNHLFYDHNIIKPWAD